MTYAQGLNGHSLIVAFGLAAVAGCSAETSERVLFVCDLASDCPDGDVCSQSGRCTIGCRTDLDCQERYRKLRCGGKYTRKETLI